MDSPPSPLSPPSQGSPPRSPTEEEIKAREEENRQNEVVTLTATSLTLLEQDTFITTLINILKNQSMSVFKRYLIAEAINTKTTNADMGNNENAKEQICTALKKDLFRRDSDFHRALNFQQNRLFPFTFFGKMALLSYDYSRSLQLLHAIVLSERASSNTKTEQPEHRFK